MTTHNHYPAQPAWQKRELDTSDRQYVLEKLDSVPYLAAALTSLGEGLAVGSSRTVYNPPANQFYEDSLDAMIGSARLVAETIHWAGIEEGLRDALLEVRMNEVPEQFEPSALSEAVKGNVFPDTPIGYIRAENTEEGLKASVGALEPQTQSHYSIPLN